MEKIKVRKYCFVPGCKSGYSNSKEDVSFFKAPKDSAMRKKWELLIPRTDKNLSNYSVVCELHFEENFIERNFKHIVNGNEVLIPRERPKLSREAIPTVFPNLPAYLTKRLPKKRKSKECSSSVPLTPKRKCVSNDSDIVSQSAIVNRKCTSNDSDVVSQSAIVNRKCTSNDSDVVSQSAIVNRKCTSDDSNSVSQSLTAKSKSFTITAKTKCISEASDIVPLSLTAKGKSNSDTSAVVLQSFGTCLNPNMNINLASKHWIPINFKTSSNVSVFATWAKYSSSSMAPDRHIVLDWEKMIGIAVPCNIYISGILWKTVHLTTIQDLENLITEIDKVIACEGAGTFDEYSSVFFTSKLAKTLLTPKYEKINHAYCTVSVNLGQKSCCHCKYLRKKMLNF